LTKIDIIIVNYNSTDYLLECLASVYETIDGLSVNIFVQDNNSTDGIERVKIQFPNVVLTINPQNVGFAAAINRVLDFSSAPYAMLLNPDSIVQKGFFKKLLDFLEANPDVGVVGPKILNEDGTVQGSARSFPTAMTALFGRNSFLSKYFPNNKITSKNILTTQSDGRTPFTVGWVSGACMMIRKRALQKVGTLDEGFFMYWEDADLCKRMWIRGWKVVYCPHAAVIHYVAGSSKKLRLRTAYEFHKSSFKLFSKYAGPLAKAFSPFVAFALSCRLALMAGYTFLSTAVKQKK
jgi:GT2 family glycosyltransferase